MVWSPGWRLCRHKGSALRWRVRPLIVVLAAWLLYLPCRHTLCYGAGQPGAKVANFSLKDTLGRVHSLSDYAGKIVVLSFWSFKCPVSLANDERLKALQADYEAKGVVVLAVSSSANESAEEVRRNAANLDLPFPVLLDEEGVLSERLGATHAPGIFIIDGASNLRYQGSFTGDRKTAESGRGLAAREAIEDILAGRAVKTPETRFSGCMIRRKAF
jgi:peroxiredoxin